MGEGKILTCREDVRCQGKREEGRYPRSEVAGKDGLRSSDLRDVNTDAVARDYEVFGVPISRPYITTKKADALTGGASQEGSREHSDPRIPIVHDVEPIRLRAAPISSGRS